METKDYCVHKNNEFFSLSWATGTQFVLFQHKMLFWFQMIYILKQFAPTRLLWILPLVPILTQINLIHTSPFYFFTIHFHFILPAAIIHNKCYLIHNIVVHINLWHLC
jgi:hypothetical protein